MRHAHLTPWSGGPSAIAAARTSCITSCRPSCRSHSPCGRRSPQPAGCCPTNPPLTEAVALMRRTMSPIPACQGPRCARDHSAPIEGRTPSPHGWPDGRRPMIKRASASREQQRFFRVTAKAKILNATRTEVIQWSRHSACSCAWGMSGLASLPPRREWGRSWATAGSRRLGCRAGRCRRFGTSEKSLALATGPPSSEALGLLLKVPQAARRRRLRRPARARGLGPRTILR